MADEKVTLHVSADISEVRRELEDLRRLLKETSSSSSSTQGFAQSMQGNSNKTVAGNNEAMQFGNSLKELSRILNDLPNKLNGLKNEAHTIRSGGTNSTASDADRLMRESQRAVYGQHIGNGQSRLNNLGIDRNGNFVNQRSNFHQERHEYNESYKTIGKRVRNIAKQNQTFNNKVQKGEDDQSISYEAYHGVQNGYAKNFENSKGLFNNLNDQQVQARDKANAYGNKAATSLNSAIGVGGYTYQALHADNASDRQRYKQYAKSAMSDAKTFAGEQTYYKDLETKLQDLTNTLKDSNREAQASQSKLGSNVESGNTNVRFKRGSMLDMAQSRAFAIGMNTFNQAQSNITGYYQGGNQARMQMQDSVNSMTMGAAGNGGYTYRADNQITNMLAQRGIKNGTGYAATDMAGFAGNYAQSTGNVGTNSDVNAAGYTSQLARYAGLGTQGANQLVSTLGLAGSINNAGSLKGITRQFQGMMSSTNTSGMAIQQAQGLSSLISNQYYAGNRVSSSDASHLIALQGTMSRYGFKGQQGAQQINTMANGISQNGYNNPATRFAWMMSDPGRYGGAVGQAQQQLDMNNPLSAKNAGHLSGFISNYKMTMGHGNDTLTAAGLMNQLGVSGQFAKKLVKASDNGDLTPQYLKRMQKKYGKKGKGTESHEKRQFEAQGNSTLDIKVAIKQNGQIATSQAMDSARGTGNGITKHLPGIVNAGFSTVGNMAGSMISTAGGLGLAHVFNGGIKALGKRGGLTGKIFGGLSSLFGGGKGKEATDAAETVAKDAGKDGIFKRMFRAGKGKLSGLGSLFKTGAKKGGSWLKAGGSLVAGGAKKGGSWLKDLFKVGGSKGAEDLAGKGASDVAEKGGVKLAERLGLKGAEKIGGKLIPGVGWAMAGVDAIRGAGDIAKDPGNALAHPFKSIGSLLGLDRVNANKGKKHKSKSDNDSESYTIKHANGVIKSANIWLHNFNVALDKAEKVVRQANDKTGNSKGKSGGSGPNKSSSSPSSTNFPNGKKTKSPTSWSKNIQAAAKAMGVKLKKGDVGLIEANIAQESGGNPNATNSGHSGILQYGKSTFDKYKVKGHTSRKNGNSELLALFNDKSWRSDLKNRTKGSWGPTGSVRKHAHGGIFNNEQSGTIAENNSPEAIVPLSFDKRSDATSVMNTISGYMGMNLSHGSRSTSNSNSVNYSPKNSFKIDASGNNNGDFTSLKQQLIQVQSKIEANSRRSMANKVASFYAN